VERTELEDDARRKAVLVIGSADGVSLELKPVDKRWRGVDKIIPGTARLLAFNVSGFHPSGLCNAHAGN